jgi:hypothetical protein
MALPTTGSLSGDQIDDEFPDSIDGGRPMSLSEYRGQRASKNGNLYTLPASPNSISYSDFRGVTAGYFIDVLIVGSGGNGGTPDGNNQGNSGGGGGGGFAQIVNSLFVIPGVEYDLVVGGVDGDIQDGRRGQNGKSSSFTYNNVTYLSLGGGGGGGGSISNANDRQGRDGGNGGGQGTARVGTDPQTWYGSALNTNTCQSGDTCIGKRGGGAVYQAALSSEGGGGGGTTQEGGRGWFTQPLPDPNQPNSSGVGGFGIGVGFLNGATFNVNNEVRTKVIDGFGGGGGAGNSVTNTEAQLPGANGGGDGTNPFAADNQLNRDGYSRTGGGGGGGSRYNFNGTDGINGAGGGGTGVVIVRYRSSSILDNMGDVSASINVIRRNGNPDSTWKYLIFGRNTRHSNSLSLKFRA